MIHVLQNDTRALVLHPYCLLFTLSWQSHIRTKYFHILDMIYLTTFYRSSHAAITKPCSNWCNNGLPISESMPALTLTQVPPLASQG